MVRGLGTGGGSPGPYLGTADLFFAFFQGAAQHGGSPVEPPHAFYPFTSCNLSDYTQPENSVLPFLI